MKMVSGFGHVALYTNQFEKTIQFYEDVFDAKNLGCFKTNVRGCWLQIGKDILEIFEGEKRGEGVFKHIAVACDDVDALYNRALAYGALEHVQPKDIELALDQPIKARIAFIKGINDEQIELFNQK